MKLCSLSLRDKEIFRYYLGLRRHELSAYSFESIYIWRKIFAIRWAIIRDCLCVFFQDRMGCFLYLPPVGRVDLEVIREVFRIMDAFNKNKEVSRIENIEDEDKEFYESLGFSYYVEEKFADYLYRRIDLVELKGNRFKSKRASVNYFLKHYPFDYLPYSLKERLACLKLYDLWSETRSLTYRDSLYQGMLKDTKICLGVLLGDYRCLNFMGRIVKIDNKVKAFTFGFTLNKDTFCILYEITDLKIKGLAQFIFWRFVQELTQYKYINTMDDSGLKNLRKAKLSYHPLKLIPAYILRRNYGAG
ncbi:MAG: phosphatidylglycerol lysyltransferase domain-containing protein [Candidatus Omnitrophica bacterium]|nr:phosphatidylglycerol lysyltransferase domain-containing protein [Candidatus Omnitrophota bacterium]